MAEEADYLTQLTGGSSGFNAMLASNSDDAPKKTSNKPMGTGEYQQNVSDDRKKLDALQVKEDKLPFAPPPELKEAPKPENYQTDPMQKFGSAGSVIATLGSLFTRKKMTNSFNSLAAVNNSISQGDASKFKAAYDTWKVDNENAIKMADWQQKNIKDHLDRLKDGESNVDADIRLLGIATGDPSLEHAAQLGQVDNLYLTRQQKLQDLKTSSETINDRIQYAQAKIDDAATKKGSPLTPQETIEAKVAADKEFDAKPTADSNSALPPGDPGIKFRIGLAATGDPSAFQNISRGKSGDSVRNAIWAGLAAEPNMTPEKLAALHLKFKSLTSEEGTLGTQTAKLATAGEEFDRLADLAEESSNKVDRTKYPTLNKAIEAYDAGSGDTDIVGLVTNARGAVNTWARAVNPNGVATVEATTAGTHLLDVAYSKGQFSEALKQMRNETKAARAAPAAVQKGIGDQINPNKAGNSDNVAPEGTIIHNGNITKKKVNGEWVTQ